MYTELSENFFARRLSALRMQKGVSAREMSLSIGQNESYINRIENKRSYPSLQLFFYICEYLNVTPQEFFNEDIKYPQQLNEIIKIFNNLLPSSFKIFIPLLKN